MMVERRQSSSLVLLLDMWTRPQAFPSICPQAFLSSPTPRLFGVLDLFLALWLLWFSQVKLWFLFRAKQGAPSSKVCAFVCVCVCVEYGHLCVSGGVHVLQVPESQQRRRLPG